MAFYSDSTASNINGECSEAVPQSDLGSDYNGYDDALEVCGLEKLAVRREARCLKFVL